MALAMKMVGLVWLMTKGMRLNVGGSSRGKIIFLQIGVVAHQYLSEKFSALPPNMRVCPPLGYTEIINGGTKERERGLLY